MEVTDVVILGGGISGLHTAFELAKKGISFKLLEARSRLGGRIYSPSSNDGMARFDIGPSWFWPDQSHIKNLIVELGLQNKIFEQFYLGDSIYEPVESEILRGMNGISMQGSLRMQGGLKTIIDQLHANIRSLAGDASVYTDAKAKRINFQSQGDESIDISLENNTLFKAKKVVLAMPPRVALNEIVFSPILSSERITELTEVATWMAGHAKMVAIYENAFWREDGLSGDVISQKGPMSEIHDASPATAGVFSLFGFFSTPPQHRDLDKQTIDANIVEQLVRIFGEKASSPIEILYKDWATDVLTATSHDQQIQNHHPSNRWSTRTEKTFNDCLIWSGTESANSHYNGYIEGAIIASHTTLNLLLNH